MTAEIAVLNSQAVVLAADSAVSNGRDKVFESANKIFSLSKYQPIGVMIYSQASFMGIPWETIIKTYRSYLGKKAFSNLAEYADDFFCFLKNSDIIINNQKDESDLIYEYAAVLVYTLKTEVDHRVQAITDSSGTITPDNVQSITKSIIVDMEEYYKNVDALDIQLARSEFNKKYSKKLTDFFKKRMDIFGISNKEIKILITMVYLSCIKSIFPLNYSGLVFAGFGTSEIFPCVTTYKVGGSIGGQIQKERIEHKCSVIGKQYASHVIGFAQEDIISMFIEGKHPKYAELSYSTFTILLDNLVDEVSKIFHDDTPDQGKYDLLKEGIATIKKELAVSLTSSCREHFVLPTVRAISILPPKELAVLAESLISLTALHRQMSEKVATVGGPTDVALITKGDGLIWINRKHYFDPSLNHHFLGNYFKEADHDGGTD